MVRKRLVDRHRERREEVKKDANDLLISGRVRSHRRRSPVGGGE